MALERYTVQFKIRFMTHSELGLKFPLIRGINNNIMTKMELSLWIFYFYSTETIHLNMKNGYKMYTKYNLHYTDLDSTNNYRNIANKN